MPSYGKKAPVKRVTASVVHRRHQIVAVLRSDGPDFDPLAGAQFLDNRIVGWLDQDRTSPCIRSRRETSRRGRSKSSSQMWSGLQPRTLIWIKHRDLLPAIVTGLYAARTTRKGLVLRAASRCGSPVPECHR